MYYENRKPIRLLPRRLPASTNPLACRTASLFGLGRGPVLMSNYVGFYFDSLVEDAAYARAELNRAITKSAYLRRRLQPTMCSPDLQDGICVFQGWSAQVTKSTMIQTWFYDHLKQVTANHMCVHWPFRGNDGWIGLFLRQHTTRCPFSSA